MPALRNRRPPRTRATLLALLEFELLSAACAHALAGARVADAAAAASTPTTTYVPSGGAALPSTTPTSAPGATPTSAATTPGAVATTPGTPGAAPAASAAHTATAGKGDKGLSSGAIVIAALAALLILVCAGWGLARRSAFEPHWLISARHAMAEAGFRASATWSEFTDWLRLGR